MTTKEISINELTKETYSYLKNNGISLLEFCKKNDIPYMSLTRMLKEGSTPNLELTTKLIKAIKLKEEEQNTYLINLFPELKPFLQKKDKGYVVADKYPYYGNEYDVYLQNPKYAKIIHRALFKEGVSRKILLNDFGEESIRLALELVSKGLLDYEEEKEVFFKVGSTQAQFKLSTVVKAIPTIYTQFDYEKNNKDIEAAQLITARISMEGRKKAYALLKSLVKKVHKIVEEDDKSGQAQDQDITITYALIDLEDPEVA